MTLGQIIVFIVSIIILAFIIRYLIVDLEFPHCLIKSLKRYRCPICGKRLWTPYSKCCQGTPEYEAWRRAAKQRYEKLLAERRHARHFDETISSSRSYRERERDCPRCHGKPGNYMCPMCEGRGKTFIR